MYRFNKLLFNLFIVMTLTFSTAAFACSSMNAITAQAAVKAPSLLVKTKLLYSGYKDYKMQIFNLAKGAKVTYKTSHKDVASVKKGVVKPGIAGFTVITANIKQNKKSYSMTLKVTVKNPSITITDDIINLKVGDSYQFKTKVLGTDDKAVWSVADSSIASVSTDGKVTGVSAGCTTLYAKAGNKTQRYVINIINNYLGTLSTDVTVNEPTTIWVNSYYYDDKEVLSLDKTDSEIASYKMGETTDYRVQITITPKKIGNDSITVTSSSTGEKLVIHINVVGTSVKNLMSSTQIYDKCIPCTVEIEATGDTMQALGSGFFIGNGRIVTNYHVIQGAKKIVVSTSDKKEYEIKKILGYSAQLDIAILELDIDHSYLPLCQTVAGGEDIYTLGSPLGLTGTMTKGMVSNASRVIDNEEYIQIDASISQGNSGGPLVNSYGEVVGINTLYYDGGQNLNFAIGIKELQKIETNVPLTVTQYHMLYEDNWRYSFENNAIAEDQTKSQKASTSQSLYPGYGINNSISVKGSIARYEYGDLYYFEVGEACYLQGILQADNLSDLNHITFSLYNDAGKNVSSGMLDKEELTSIISEYLEPGGYYIFIYLPKGYKGPTLDYLFSLYFDE